MCADLLSQAEHGQEWSRLFWWRHHKHLLTGLIWSCGAGLCCRRIRLWILWSQRDFCYQGRSLDRYVAICNAYVPEHVEILTAQPKILEPKLHRPVPLWWDMDTRADLVILLQDQVTFTTGGAARIFSGLTTAFYEKINGCKWSPIKCWRILTKRLKFARMESLPARAVFSSGLMNRNES